MPATLNVKEFKKVFTDVAAASGFTAAHGGWCLESPEAIVALHLQKSNFGNHFELNVKVFVQGLFGDSRFSVSKELLKKLPGDVFVRPPERYNASLDLDRDIPRDQRHAELEIMFREFLTPTTTDALSRAGLASLDARGVVHLLPAVRRRLAAIEDTESRG